MRKKKQPNPIDVFVGQRIRLRRTMLNISQEKLGGALGITFQQVQKYEKAANRISASRLAQLAETLGIEPAWFFEGAPDGGMHRLQSTDEVMAVMSEFFLLPFAVDLANSYIAIKHNSDRRAIADFARTVASI